MEMPRTAGRAVAHGYSIASDRPLRKFVFKAAFGTAGMEKCEKNR